MATTNSKGNPCRLRLCGSLTSTARAAPTTMYQANSIGFPVTVSWRSNMNGRVRVDSGKLDFNSQIRHAYFMAKRASYRQGVIFIALNDEDGATDALNVEVVTGYISTSLLAELFGKEPEEVAQDIIRYRLKQKRSKTDE